MRAAVRMLQSMRWEAWGQRLTLDTPRTTQEQPESSNGVSSVKR